MKRELYFTSTILLLSALSVGISSCDDDEPPAKAKLSITEATRSVAENVGTIQVDIVLDKPASEDIVVDYDLRGTALEVGSAASQSEADYEIVGDAGQVEIEKGESKGTIEIKIYSDAAFEQGETIEISIDDVDSENVEIAPENEIVITITNDDQQTVASFTNTTLTINEDFELEDYVKVEVRLDQPASQDITLNYTLDGQAIDSLFAWENEIPFQYVDYFVNGTSGQVTIPAGQQSANIELLVLTDYVLENTEDIVITLTGGTGGVQLGTNKTMTISVEQQNGKVVALLWDPAYTDVNMDLIVWYGSDLSSVENLLAYSNFTDTEPQEELLIIPSVITAGQNAAFGASYVYYSGSADPLDFQAHILDFVDGDFVTESDSIFAGQYTASNKNPYRETQIDPAIVHKFELVNGVFENFSEIEVPSSGSRIRTNSAKTFSSLRNHKQMTSGKSISPKISSKKVKNLRSAKAVLRYK